VTTSQLSLITCFLYVMGAFPSFRYLTRAHPFIRLHFYLLSLPALIGHGFLLYRWIETGGGQNLPLLYMVSLFLWLIGWCIVSMPKHFHAISIGLYPLAALSILLATYYPSQHIVHTAHDIGALIHIGTATLAASILGLAGLQACLITLQSKRLHQPHAFWQGLPPLEAMEQLLFRIIAVGFLFLTSALISGFYFIAQTYPLSKMILSFFIWAALLSLLFSRYILHYRGMRIVKSASLSIAGLWITYFISKIF